jgi:transcriptional regulator NrdR family protein
MNCPNCQHNYTKVLETRTLPEQPRWTKRQRLCTECQIRFFTIEMPASDWDTNDVSTDQDDASDAPDF